MPRTSAIDALCDEYTAWNKSQGLDLGSADEHLFDENLTAEQRQWLALFCERWDDAASAEREQHDDEPPSKCTGHCSGDKTYHERWDAETGFCRYCGEDGNA